jgi:hypothetical protein
MDATHLHSVLTALVGKCNDVLLSRSASAEGFEALRLDGNGKEAALRPLLASAEQLVSLLRQALLPAESGPPRPPPTPALVPPPAIGAAHGSPHGSALLFALPEALLRHVGAWCSVRAVGRLDSSCRGFRGHRRAFDLVPRADFNMRAAGLQTTPALVLRMVRCHAASALGLSTVAVGHCFSLAVDSEGRVFSYGEEGPWLGQGEASAIATGRARALKCVQSVKCRRPPAQTQTQTQTVVKTHTQTAAGYYVQGVGGGAAAGGAAGGPLLPLLPLPPPLPLPSRVVHVSCGGFPDPDGGRATGPGADYGEGEESGFCALLLQCGRAFSWGSGGDGLLGHGGAAWAGGWGLGAGGSG